MNRPKPDDAVRRGRVKLALLAVFFLLPIGASWIAWRFELVSGTSGNYGTLLPPRPVALPAIAALKGKWVLVQFDGGACGAACERKHYFMRQLRRAQGKEMQRIERLWLVTDAVPPRAELLAAIEDTVIAPAGTAAAEFPAERSVVDHIYLVDPLGNLMMRFPRDPDPLRVIRDLQRLLKVSSFG
ncbi:MAG TPA: cytochrome C oxidase subunit I [Burkholderiales bacterium]|nr:cytochrome C oxidase subunit I [Burkholderiales bacterium]